jgi:BON domain
MKTDSMLQQDAIDELLYEPGLDASNVDVVANGGVITLTGTVPSYPGRYAAEYAAERVAGVRAVADETKVDLPSLHKRSDKDIAAAALNAMSWQVRVPSVRFRFESITGGSHSKGQSITTSSGRQQRMRTAPDGRHRGQ